MLLRRYDIRAGATTTAGGVVRASSMGLCASATVLCHSSTVAAAPYARRILGSWGIVLR